MLTKVDLEDAGPGLRERIMEKLLTVEHSSLMQADLAKNTWSNPLQAWFREAWTK